MVDWLKRGDNDAEPSDKATWGIVKGTYTFADLATWKVHGTLDLDKNQIKASSKAASMGRNNERKQKDNKGSKNQSEGENEKGKKKKHHK